jgi:hypothetical protein
VRSNDADMFDENQRKDKMVTEETKIDKTVIQDQTNDQIMQEGGSLTKQKTMSLKSSNPLEQISGPVSVDSNLGGDKKIDL